MGKTQVTILNHDHWYTLMKYVDDRIIPAQFALQREIMTKMVSDWRGTDIPTLTEYYSTLYLLGETLEKPYLSPEHYADLKKKIVEQGKEGIPVEQGISLSVCTTGDRAGDWSMSIIENELQPLSVGPDSVIQVRRMPSNIRGGLSRSSRNLSTVASPMPCSPLWRRASRRLSPVSGG